MHALHESQQLAASDKLEQEAGTSENAHPSTFGVALRCRKLVMARDSQESSGANVCINM